MNNETQTLDKVKMLQSSSQTEQKKYREEGAQTKVEEKSVTIQTNDIIQIDKDLQVEIRNPTEVSST